MAPVDGRFVLERLLGRGSYGEVHLARDDDGSAVVVKLLHARLAADPEAAERFRREVRALERLAHPHVVPLLTHGVCAARGQPYYVMPWSPGASLHDLLRAEGPLPAARAARLVDQLLDALELAHGQGVLHRDLKPNNLLVERPGAPDEHLLVFDWGLSKHLAGGEETRAGLTGELALGTPAYMAPEQCQGLAVTPRTDVYAVGCLLFQALAGAPPFDGEPMALLRQQVVDPPPRLDEVAPGAPPALAALVARCLAKRSEERLDAAACREALRTAVPDAGWGDGSAAERFQAAATQAFPPLDGATATGERAPAGEAPATRASAPVAEPAGPGRAHVHALALTLGVLSGPDRGALTVLPAAGRVLAGAGPGADLVVRGPGVVSRHAVLEVGPAGVRAAPTREGPLRLGDRRVGPGGATAPLGVLLRLGEPGALAIVDRLRSFRAPSRRRFVLRRLDARAPDAPVGPAPVALEAAGQVARVRLVHGRPVLEAEGDARPRVGGRPVGVALLEDGDEVELRGPRPGTGVRYRLEARAAAGFTAPLAVGGAARVLLAVERGGAVRARWFLFGGERVRFGREPARAGARRNDLVLWAFPAPGEDPEATARRTRSVSGHHGTLHRTRDGVAVSDDGSSLGTELDGRRLEPGRRLPLDERCELLVGRAVELAGRLVRLPAALDPDRPVGALRLTRTRDGLDQGYVFVLRAATLGAGDDDAVRLPFPGVAAGQARLDLRGERLVLTPLRAEPPVALARRGPLQVGEAVALAAGDVLRIGATAVRVAWAGDADFLPQETPA